MLDTLNGVYQMQITRTSRLTGKTSVMDLNLTQAELDAWVDGMLIQDVMPQLSAEEREFLMTGITPAEWDSVFA
tara:strand:- start:176 stop:397 length:222 start_codon:yes stop_codon:yes gene_type:complete